VRLDDTDTNEVRPAVYSIDRHYQIAWKSTELFWRLNVWNLEVKSGRFKMAWTDIGSELCIQNFGERRLQFGERDGDRTKKNLRGFGSLANYVHRATAACWRSSANFCG
jgi:hypothetical protein